MKGTNRKISEMETQRENNNRSERMKRTYNKIIALSHHFILFH